MGDSFSRGMDVIVKIPLQEYLNRFWEEEVKGHFNMRFFIFFMFIGLI